MNAREFLKQHNTTPSKLAKDSGVPEQTVFALVNGHRDLYKCSLDTVKRLANAMGVSLDDVYEGWYSENPNTAQQSYTSYGRPFEDAWHMPIEDNVTLAKRNLVDSIYKSAKLEGLTATYADTEAIVYGGIVNGLKQDEITAINNLKHAWRFVLDTLDYDVDLSYIRQVNQEIGTHLIAGCGNLRTFDVSIGGTGWRPSIPEYDSVAAEIAKIRDSSASNTDKALTAMLYICRTQPFVDGNKRTATLVANQMSIRNGCGIISVPEALDAAFKERLVAFYESGDMSDAKDFLYRNCLSGFQPQRSTQPPMPDEAQFYNHSKAPEHDDFE